MIGHRAFKGLDNSYDRSTPEDRLQEYLKAVDELTINNEKRLKSRIQSIKQEHSREYDALKAEMNQLKLILDNLGQGSGESKN